MNSYILIPITSLIVYSVLISFVVRYRRTRIHQRFILFLLVASAWSVSTIMLSIGFMGLTPLWGALVPLSIVCLAVTYYYFISAFVQHPDGLAVKLGYAAIVLILVPLAALGDIPSTVSVEGGVIDIRYGWLLFLLWGIGAPFFALSVYQLVKRYRALRDPLARTRIVYVLAGISLVFMFLSRDLFPPLPTYPIDHIGQIFNALLISYVVLRYQLLDIKWIMRKGVAYSAATIVITALVLFFALIPYQFTRDWTSTAGMVSMAVIALFVAVLYNPLRIFAQKIVDRLFYGKTYDYRQMMLNFSTNMSNVLNLNELAEAILVPLVKALHTTQASLMLPNDGFFISQFAHRLDEQEPVTQIKIRADSPIISWLDGEIKPLSRDRIDVAPVFKGLWQSEEVDLDAAGVELFCPIKNKGKLIGILALGVRKQSAPYSTDDMNLLMTLAGEVGAAIENAQLYAQAQMRVHTDGLTELFNHRYFHERLEEEIARGSRFGEIFSLIFIDVDSFKTYNDIHGHLAGDVVLKGVAEHIKESIRGVDLAFRYGGDEFAIILPEASVSDSNNVAERIRKIIESKMDMDGIPLTCSLGITSWPTNGVLREDLIRSADAALYRAKRMGGNRTCLAPEQENGEKLEAEIKPEERQATLSTIYALAATVDARDHYTYGHSKKVSKYATDMAEALGFSQDKISTIRAAALLHDIGKIGVSDGILRKPGVLETEEWVPIHSHPRLGVAILKHVKDLAGCLSAVLYHHERYDGTGYPSGLSGDNIPLDARILAIADAYDAMTSQRPYRPVPMTHQQAIEELRRYAGQQFDPQLIKVFMTLSDRAPRKVGDLVAAGSLEAD